jgi:hypothetical protein
MWKKIGLIALFISTWLVSFSQQKQLTLLSDSNSVSIKIDGNTVAVWNIDPDTKPWTEPDVFTIDRSSKEQHVTYLSNRDSLTFLVKPGEIYDLNIAIKNRGNFPLRLTTFGEPVIQQSCCLAQLVEKKNFRYNISALPGNDYATSFLADDNYRRIYSRQLQSSAQCGE